jgi:hypothetical protein
MNIAQKLMALKEFVPKGPSVFLSVYSSEKHFGGPEEGGWWYTVTTLMGSIPMVDHECAEALVGNLTAELETQNRVLERDCNNALANLPDPDIHGGSDDPPIGFVGAENLFVHIEDVRGSLDNSRDPAPHYE